MIFLPTKVPYRSSSTFIVLYAYSGSLDANDSSANETTRFECAGKKDVLFDNISNKNTTLSSSTVSIEKQRVKFNCVLRALYYEYFLVTSFKAQIYESK